MAADENLPDDVPEADAIEQRQEVTGGEVVDEEAPAARDDLGIDDSLEVPEADALDQSRAVPTDDEPMGGE